MELFTFNNYKDFVRNWIQNQEKSGRGQLRKISEYLNVSSVLISQIVNGDKEISMEQALKLCEYLGLSELEKKYFLSLVSEARAGTYELKDFYKKEARELKKLSKDLSKRVTHKKALSEEDTAIFYSDWKYSAVRLACGLPGQTKHEIQQMLNIDEEPFEKYFDFLLSRKLIIYDKGKLSLGAASTHLPKTSPFVVQHHRNWRIKAIESADKMREDEIMYTAPMCVSKGLFEKLNTKILKLIEEFVEEAVEAESEELYYLNLDLRRLV